MPSPFRALRRQTGAPADPARRRWIHRAAAASPAFASITATPISTALLGAGSLGAGSAGATSVGATSVGAAMLLAPRSASAHHGYAGVYDFSRPLYLAGTIDAIWIGLPHVRLRLRLDSDLALPRDREPYRAIEDAEARQMLGRLRLPDRRGTIDVVLHARMSRPLMNEPEALPVGLHTEIIGYPRTTSDEYRGEIVGVLIRLQDGRMLVASMPMRLRR